MAVETKPWTRAELARLPRDGNRYEVLDGQLLVTPQASYAHQSVAMLLAIALETFVRPSGIAHVVGPGAVPFGPNELQPDVMVIPGARRRRSWTDAPTPLLVAEVLSQSSRRFDLGVKLAAYRERLAIPTVWVVDHHAREVHVSDHSGAMGAPPRIERARLTWHPAGAAAPLTIDLVQFFREALGE